MIDLNSITTLCLYTTGGCFIIVVIKHLLRWRKRVQDREREQRNLDRAVERVKATTYTDVEWRGPRGNVK
jgi:membrane protein implicated in regulation of membrane protease activity